MDLIKSKKKIELHKMQLFHDLKEKFSNFRNVFEEISFDLFFEIIDEMVKNQ